MCALHTFSQSSLEITTTSGFDYFLDSSQQVGTHTVSSYDHCTACDKLDVSGTLPIVTSFVLNQDPRWKQSVVEAQLYYAIDSKTNLFCVILVHTDDYF
jgi:hypothetical protein